ncbi:LCP family protein [Lachnospiraceae bacterium PAL227]|uniref:LCP family protein n=2 Tax=Bacteria TaxID=2 RepID=A0ABT1ELE5_9FIRM|nr:LCP family protein [Ohessyouella blattaphilus]MCP1111520.1 LCP family protein [Ohessyouella blattaphilus]MCR8564914.1 LCP family protein [Ohessyouella blattaphilus]
MKGKQIAIIIMSMILAVLSIVAIYIFRQQDKATVVEDANDMDTPSSYLNIEYQGEYYKFNTNLELVLFMGIDRKHEVELTSESGEGGQSDSLILLVLDKSKKTTTLVTISREAMVNVKMYDRKGDYIQDYQAQIALQYSYGDSGKKSAQLTKDLVSEVIHDIPIRSYLSLDIAGIPGIVDAIGGVPITMNNDYTEVDPAFFRGAQLTLDGEQAMRFVQHRNTEESGSNIVRMERQSEFIRALFAALGNGKGKNMVGTLLEVAEPYLITDMSVSSIEKLADYDMEEEIRQVPGTIIAGEHDEFYIDEAGLQELLIKMFYFKKDE